MKMHEVPATQVQLHDCFSRSSL